MIIWTETEDGVRYYVATNSGRPIFGAKASAADLVQPHLSTVVKHLRLMMPAATLGVMDRGEKFDPKKHRPVE